MPAPLPAALVPLALLPSLVPSTTVIETTFDRASGFVPPTAVSYAPDLVPYGSKVRVSVTRRAGQTSVEVRMSGVAAGHEFPAHVHTGPCASDAASSSPHYQNVADPIQPSTDPAYANDRNEMRLTVRTDKEGRGTATSAVDWSFREGGARSIVLHAGRPAGARGTADRVACVNVRF